MGRMLKLMLAPVNVALCVPCWIINKIEFYAEQAAIDANALIDLMEQREASR